MPVPFALIKLQDKLTNLAAASSSKDTPVTQQLRLKHGSRALSYLDWKDVQELYAEGLEPGEVYSEHDLQTLVDFMDLQGVVMHNNAEALRNLVILDQEWLIKQLTMIIRDPKLHNKEVDKRMGKSCALLYTQGRILNTCSHLPIVIVLCQVCCTLIWCLKFGHIFLRLFRQSCSR
jgi:hypothetical protein